MSRPFARHCIPATSARVAVLMGGTSSEREVSLDSGRNVLEALQRRGVDAFAVDGIPDLVAELTQPPGRRIRPRVQHPPRQPRRGRRRRAAGPAGRARRAIHRIRRARLRAVDGQDPHQAGVALGRPADAGATPAWSVATTCVAAAHKIGLPVIVKPACEGSSVGVTRCFKDADLPAAVALASRYDGPMLVEQLIQGEEYTVGVLGTEALPSIRIVPAGEYYDYHAKYVAEDTQYICPGLAGAAEQELGSLALGALLHRGVQRLGPRRLHARPLRHVRGCSRSIPRPA